MERTRSISRPPLRPARGAACGKVILLGEHAVVYGRTALAAAIGRAIRIEVRPATGTPCLDDPRLAEALARAARLLGLSPSGYDIRVEADLPAGIGLGSSAALSVALIRALAAAAGMRLPEVSVCAHAFEIEKIFHGFPSGIDNTVATWGGLIAFRRNSPVRPLSSAAPLHLAIAFGCAPRRTGAVVAALRRRWTERRDNYEALFDAVETLVHQGITALGRGDLNALGAALDDNHRLLRALGVSTPELDEIAALARDCGALGAKLTGGGGGGAVICLCRDGAGASALATELQRRGLSAFATGIGTEAPAIVAEVRAPSGGRRTESAALP